MVNFERHYWQTQLNSISQSYVVFDDGTVRERGIASNGEEKSLFLGAMALITARIIDLDTGVNTYVVSMFSDNQVIEHEFDATIFNKMKISKLHEFGAMVHTANAEHVVTLLELSASVAPIEYKTEKLGWIDTEIVDHPIFMGDKAYLLPGGQKIQSMSGRYDLVPTGSWDEFHELLIDVSNVIPMMAILSTAFASLLVPLAVREGLLSIQGWLTSIVGDSSTGKTTSAILAASLLGNVGIGKGSLVTNWNGTQQSYAAKIADVHGFALVFDEAATITGMTLDGFVFDLSSGVERARSQVNGKLRESRTWSVIVLSTSETSILPMLPSQNGTMVRTIELTGQFTESSEQAERVVAVAKKHHGWAIPKLMEHIASMGFDKFVEELTQQITLHKTSIVPRLGGTPLAERIATNLGLIVVGAEYMAKVLDLPKLDVDAIKDYLVERMNEQLALFKDDIDLRSTVEQWVLRNHAQIGLISKFQILIPNQPIGYVFNPSRLDDDNEFFDIGILKSELKAMLARQNVKQISAELKKFVKAGFLITGEGDRQVTRKTVSGIKAPYYMLRFSRDSLMYLPKIKEILLPDDNRVGTENAAPMQVYDPDKRYAEMQERKHQELMEEMQEAHRAHSDDDILKELLEDA